jgi:hypothetical protein
MAVMRAKQGIIGVVFGALTMLSSACDDGDDGSDEQVGDGDTTGDGDGDGDPSTGDGDGDTNGDFGSDDGELMGCALNESAADCMAEAGCSPVLGKPLVDDGNGGWCTDAAAEEYIGCASGSELCPALGKTLCDGDDIWRTTACVPDNLDVCDAPGEITGDC